MHGEIVPTWLVLSFVLVLGLCALTWLRLRLSERAKKQRRQARRRKSASYARAWEWVMRLRQPRVPRLTDQRSRTE